MAVWQVLKKMCRLLLHPGVHTIDKINSSLIEQIRSLQQIWIIAGNQTECLCNW